MRSVVLVHPSTQYATRLAEQFFNKNIPFVFVTSVVISNRDWFYPLLPKFLKRKLGARTVLGIPPKQLYRIIRFEVKFIWTKWIKKRIFTEEDFYTRNLQFQKAIPLSLLKEADIVIGYDTSSSYLIEQCKHLKKIFILDVSIGHPTVKAELFKKIALAYPQWKDAVHEKPKYLLNNELSEIQQADAIVVPSAFVKQTYLSQNIQENKIFVNPFGVNLDFFKPLPEKQVNFPIRFVFLGIKNARKGIPFLLDVWKELDVPAHIASLTIAGPEQIHSSVILPNGVTELGFVNPSDRATYFSSGHVFIFPSFFEGLAQVQLEAAACGLPVIGTTNSGASEFIVNELNGFIIQPGQAEEFKKAIRYFIHHPERILNMGQEARKAALAFSWDAYGNRWQKIIEEVA